MSAQKLHHKENVVGEALPVTNRCTMSEADLPSDTLFVVVHGLAPCLLNNVTNLHPESKTAPKKRKCKKAKWLSEKALQIAVERREVKSTKGKMKDIPI